MRWSARLVALGLVLLAAQVAFSDGAQPNIVSLPIGMWPLALGSPALIGGLLVGLLGGTARYRLAALAALLGTFFAGFGLLFLTTSGSSTINDIALMLAVVSWAGAIAIGISALRRAPSQ